MNTLRPFKKSIANKDTSFKTPMVKILTLSTQTAMIRWWDTVSVHGLNMGGLLNIMVHRWITDKYCTWYIRVLSVVCVWGDFLVVLQCFHDSVDQFQNHFFITIRPYIPYDDRLIYIWPLKGIDTPQFVAESTIF